MPKKKKFLKLEDDTRKAYTKWSEDKSKANATEMFLNLKKISKAVLIAKNYTERLKGMDIEQISYEHSTKMFERIILEKLVPVSNSKNSKVKQFPWFRYIELSIRDTIEKHHINNNIDVDLFLDVDLYNFLSFEGNEFNPALQIDKDFIEKKHEDVNVVKRFSKMVYSEKLYKALRMFYEDQEIKTLYPLSIDYLINKRLMIKRSAPQEIREFVSIFVCLAKRLVNQIQETTPNELNFIKSKDLEKITNSTIRSSVFIAAVMNDKDSFPKELLLSLDMESLYRLCAIKGGETIKIPTLDHLDSLVGAVVIASNKLTESKEIKINEIKKSLDLNLKKKLNFNNLVENILFCITNFKDETTDPLISSLLDSVNKLGEITKGLQENVDKLEGKEIVEYYVELNKSLTMFTNSFSTISKIMKKRTI